MMTNSTMGMTKWFELKFYIYHELKSKILNIKVKKLKFTHTIWVQFSI